MTDSIDRGTPTKEEIAKLKNLPQKKMRDRTEPSDLPNWAKTALVKRELYGLTWKEAAQEFNRTAGTLKNYGLSPIGKDIRQQVGDFRDNPVEVAKAMLAANALGITLDRLTALEWAKDARDYQQVDKIASDLQDRIGITKKSPKSDTPMSITIQWSGGSFEAPVIEAEAEEVVESDYEIEE